MSRRRRNFLTRDAFEEALITDVVNMRPGKVSRRDHFKLWGRVTIAGVPWQLTPRGWYPMRDGRADGYPWRRKSGL